MSTNPYQPPQTLAAARSKPPRWKWRIILPLGVIALLTLVDLIAVKDGLSLRASTDETTTFQVIVFYLNFPGIFLALFFGDLLHHPDNIAAQNRNLFLFCAGGILSWTLLAFVIGIIADVANRKSQ